MAIINISKFAGAIMILFGAMLLISSFLFLDIDEKDKKVKCYDKFSNEIIGETCIEKADKLTEEFVGFFVPGGIFIFFGLIFNMMSFDLWDEPSTNFFGWSKR